jgi:hypothetical protein
MSTLAAATNPIATIAASCKATNACRGPIRRNVT